jgi:hypothetical protein
MAAAVRARPCPARPPHCRPASSPAVSAPARTCPSQSNHPHARSSCKACRLRHLAERVWAVHAHRERMAAAHKQAQVRKRQGGLGQARRQRVRRLPGRLAHPGEERPRQARGATVRDRPCGARRAEACGQRRRASWQRSGRPTGTARGPARVSPRPHRRPPPSAVPAPAP